MAFIRKPVPEEVKSIPVKEDFIETITCNNGDLYNLYFLIFYFVAVFLKLLEKAISK